MCLATVLKATNLTTLANFQDCESMSGAVWLCEWDRELGWDVTFGQQLTGVVGISVHIRGLRHTKGCTSTSLYSMHSDPLRDSLVTLEQLRKRLASAILTTYTPRGGHLLPRISPVDPTCLFATRLASVAHR